MATTLHCDNFVGNAWKRDLCLNCFKSKEEHQIRNGEIRLPLAIPDPPKEVSSGLGSLTLFIRRMTFATVERP